MKINKKEQRLLLVLVLVLIVFGYYKFVLNPQTNKVKELVTKRNELGTKVEITKKNIATYKAKEQEYKVLNSKLMGKTERFFPEIMQEKIIVTLDDMLSKTKLEGYTLAFSEGKVVKDEKTVSTGKDNTNGQNASASANTNILKPEIAAVAITFKGSFLSIKDFIYTLENFSKRTVITQVTLGVSNEGEITGNINLEFYAVPGVMVIDKTYLDWPYSNKYGKAEPFVAGSTQNTGDITKKVEETKKESKYDFIMTTKPTSSDLPSIILGKALDATRNSYVYADNAKDEPVEVDFTQVGGKYYYKYKTSREAYPKQWNGTGMEFVPCDSNINFKIYSNKRNLPADEAGAKLKIVNGTDKIVNVMIEGEDTLRPRVQVLSEGGKVVVKIE